MSPVYDFTCELCRVMKKDVKIKLIEKELTKINCNKCGNEMTQAVAPLTFQLKGVGWFGSADTPGTGYEMWQGELDKNLDFEKRIEDMSYNMDAKDKNIKEI